MHKVLNLVPRCSKNAFKIICYSSFVFKKNFNARIEIKSSNDMQLHKTGRKTNAENIKVDKILV